MKTNKIKFFLMAIAVFFALPMMAETDMTSAVNTTGWGGTGTYTESADGVVCAENFTWGNSFPTGVRLGQTVSLPNGKYRVELYAMASSTSSRDNTRYVITDGGTDYVTLHVGDQTQAVPAYNRIAYSTTDVYTFPCVEVVNGTLTMTLTQDKKGPNWLTMQIKSLTYLGAGLWGDVNMDGSVDVADVTKTVNIILGQGDDEWNMANVNRKEDINVADVTELVNIILGQATPQTISGRIYADQTNGYQSVAMDDYLTRLNISVSGISNIASISVCSPDCVPISGDFDYNINQGQLTYGNTPLTYSRNANSDVVTLTGSASQVTARLLPVHLPNGLIVTVRTTDGKFYSQKYPNIQVGQANTLSFTNTTASQLWMSTLPGTTYFSLVSTPGSHDAATNGVASISADMARCQSEDIDGLLANGIRAFDLRPAYKGSSESSVNVDNLTIYHGIMSTGVKFKDAIKLLSDFVRENPTEAVSILFQKESGGGTKDYSDAMWESVKTIYNDNKDVIYCGHPADLTLSDVRGKVSIINRNATGLETATDLQNWGDNRITTEYELTIGDECTAVVQDKYDTDVDDKKSVFNTMLNAFLTNTEGSKYCFNYTSIAYSFAKSIASKAKTMNQYAATQINNSAAGPLGYLYGDYIGAENNYGGDIFNAIVNQNYKYVYQGLGAQ